MASTSAPTAEAASCPAGFDVFAWCVQYRQRHNFHTPEYRGEEHYVRLYVSYLRGKIEPDPAHPKYILTEKGLGYRFAELGRERARQQAREEVAGRGPCEVKPPAQAIPQHAEAIAQRSGCGGASDEARILHRIEG